MYSVTIGLIVYFYSSYFPLSINGDRSIHLHFLLALASPSYSSFMPYLMLSIKVTFHLHPWSTSDDTSATWHALFQCDVFHSLCSPNYVPIHYFAKRHILDPAQHSHSCCFQKHLLYFSVNASSPYISTTW